MKFQIYDDDLSKWKQVKWLIKHIIWFIKHYEEGDKYVLFSSTLKYHNKEYKRLNKLKHKKNPIVTEMTLKELDDAIKRENITYGELIETIAELKK